MDWEPGEWTGSPVGVPGYSWGSVIYSRNGLQRLAGEDGGHARHLAQHFTTLRTRHGGAAAELMSTAVA